LRIKPLSRLKRGKETRRKRNMRKGEKMIKRREAKV